MSFVNQLLKKPLVGCLVMIALVAIGLYFALEWIYLGWFASRISGEMFARILILLPLALLCGLVSGSQIQLTVAVLFSTCFGIAMPYIFAADPANDMDGMWRTFDYLTRELQTIAGISYGIALLVVAEVTFLASR